MTEQVRDTEALIREQIAKHAVLLYMKGTPQFPQCGFFCARSRSTQSNWSSFCLCEYFRKPGYSYHFAKNCELANFPTIVD